MIKMTFKFPNTLLKNILVLICQNDDPKVKLLYT